MRKKLKLNDSLFRKIHGSLAGVAIGDVLGMPTASFTCAEIRKRFGTVRKFLDAPTDHPIHSGLKQGQVTDDTEVTMVVIQTILEDGKVTAQGVARRLVQWANDRHVLGTKLLGPSTTQALEGLLAGKDPSETGKYGTTNGAAMRISPIGTINVGTPEKIVDDVTEVCLPTHGTSVAISAASAVAGAIAEALTPSATVSSVLKAAKSSSRLGEKRGRQVAFPSIDKRIDLAVELVENENDPTKAARILYDYVGTDISSVDSIPTALALFAASKGKPIDTITSAVNMGGDTDTIASISGGIAGAFKGIDAFPAHFVEEVERANQLELASTARRLFDFVRNRQRL